MKRILVLFLMTTSSFYLYAQGIDSIWIGERFERYDLLDFQKFQYVTYTVGTGFNGSPTLMSSETKKINYGGKNYVLITHTWSASESRKAGAFEALVEPHTLRPIQHIRNSQKGKEAYSFSDKSVTALDSASDNLEADYELELEEPVFNFEIDLETISVLPMKKGYQAVLQFFHPGSRSLGPDWYLIKVERSDILTLPDGIQIDTWVLYMDYNGLQPTRFWYTKEGQDFVKMEGEYQGVKIYKVRVF